MDRFLIETSHGEEVCLNLIQLLNAQGYLTHFDWGCLSKVHTGWAVIEAANEAEARLAIPPLVRGQARIVKVTKFDAATFAHAHNEVIRFEVFAGQLESLKPVLTSEADRDSQEGSMY